MPAGKLAVSGSPPADLTCPVLSCHSSRCGRAGFVQSAPHALDEHVPALVGPLPVAAAGGGQQRLTQLAGSADVAQALLLARCAFAGALQGGCFVGHVWLGCV